MNQPAGQPLALGSATFLALPERALWWPEAAMLVVSDLHLGKAERMARRGGALVPPYETRDTVARLAALVDRWSPGHVICLGDSFDDTAAVNALAEDITDALTGLMAGRRWTWILGNHDPGPVSLGGSCVAGVRLHDVSFRHIARPGATQEVSGHYHPKAALRGARRPAFVTDGTKLILPAFGTYTGGLDAADPAIAGLMGPDAVAILAGRTMAVLPLGACAPVPARPPVRWARGLG